MGKLDVTEMWAFLRVANFPEIWEGGLGRRQGEPFGGKMRADGGRRPPEWASEVTRQREQAGMSDWQWTRPEPEQGQRVGEGNSI